MQLVLTNTSLGLISGDVSSYYLILPIFCIIVLFNVALRTPASALLCGNSVLLYREGSFFSFNISSPSLCRLSVIVLLLTNICLHFVLVDKDQNPSLSTSSGNTLSSSLLLKDLKELMVHLFEVIHLVAFLAMEGSVF